MTPKEYIDKEYATKVDTVITNTGKKRAQETGCSSFVSPANNNKATLSQVVEYMSNLSAEEKRQFDREALKLQKPGEPGPETNLWQKRLLRVRYLERLRENGPDA